MNEWLNKLWYIHTKEYHSAMKRNELLTNATIIFKFYFSITVYIQYRFVLVSGVQYNGQKIIYLTKYSP